MTLHTNFWCGGGLFDKREIKKKYLELKEQTENNNLWDNPENAKKIFIEFNLLKDETEDFEMINKKFDQIKKELNETNDNELIELFNIELDELIEKVNIVYVNTLFKEESDKSSCFLTVHCGSGGLESEDWARMLWEMYLKYASRFFHVSIVDFSSSDDGGIKNGTMKICSKEKNFPYGYFKGETGVHRLVRISPYDKKKQRHTSFASVSVIPEIDNNIDIVIDEKEIRLDTYRASGAGGQHVNKTDSAIRITHIPTGIVVQCQNDRSQHKNKEEAFKMLKSKLYQKKLEELRKEKEELAGEKKEISWGSQIRSYIQQPYQLVKDHRNNFEIANFSKVVFDAEIEEFLTQWLKFNI